MGVEDSFTTGQCFYVAKAEHPAQFAVCDSTTPMVQNNPFWIMPSLVKSLVLPSVWRRKTESFSIGEHLLLLNTPATNKLYQKVVKSLASYPFV